MSRFTRNAILDSGKFALSSDFEGTLFTGYRNELAGNELRVGFLSQRGRWADIQMNGMYGEISGASGYSVGLARNFTVANKADLSISGDFIKLNGRMRRIGIVTSLEALKMFSANASYRHPIGRWGYAGVRVNSVRTIGGGLNMNMPSGAIYNEDTDTVNLQYSDTRIKVQNGLPAVSGWAEVAKTSGYFNFGVYSGIQSQLSDINFALGVNMRYTLR